MQMDAGLDTGPVLLREAVAIAPEDTTGALHDRLSELGAMLIVKALAQIDSLVPQAQPENGVTYAAKIDKAEARVDWSRPAVEVDHLIRGLSPFPGAWCDLGGERVKLLGSRLTDGQGGAGQILGGFTVACGDGAVAITRLQRAGKKPMETSDALRGLDLPERLT